MPGADRVAWRLGAKTRLPTLGAAVGLCLFPQEGFPDGVGPCFLSGVPRPHHSGWPHIGAAECRHLDRAAPEAPHERAGHADLCRVRVPGRCGAGSAPRHDEASHDAVGDPRLHRGGKKTRITTKAWRHLSWTLAEAPMLAERFTREFLNGTLFEEEPTELAEDEPEEESDLILHDDDDDAEDAAHEVDGARCGRCVSREHGHSCCIGSRADLHGGCRNRRRRTFFCVCAARMAGIHQSSDRQLFSRRCKTECVLASCRCCARVEASLSISPATTILVAVANFQMLRGSRDLVEAAHLSNESFEVRSGASIHSEEQLDMGCVIPKDSAEHTHRTRFSVGTRPQLIYSTQVLHLFLLCGLAEACLFFLCLVLLFFFCTQVWRLEMNLTRPIQATTLWTFFWL